ncbi:MAG: GNAT family N-acetyltransferase [Anaerolineae bacterium]|nr:GNAT family N-acetyltransferase [Anaerolineae bacterium]
MQFETLRKTSDFETFATEWNTLLSTSASNVPFLKPEYLAAWWAHRGGGEWQQGELHTVVAREEDGGIVGIAPLFLTQNPDGEAALIFIGSIEISDYLDFIVQPKDVVRFTAGLFEYLATPIFPAWKHLDLYNILDGSPTLEALKNTAQQHGWRYQQEQLQPAPQVLLTGSWEDYLASMKKKQRHELRRKMRNAANHVVPVKWYIVEDQTTLDTELDAFFELMVQEPLKKEFLTPAMQSQMRAIAHSAFEHGWLQLAFLQVGDEKAAAMFNFDYGNRVWGYNSGFSLDHRDLSSGVVLMGNILEWACGQGRQAFDFMRGDEDYKYRFGAEDRFVMRATISRD